MMNHFEELQDVLGSLDLKNLEKLRDFVRETEGTLWIAGNGGSAANALHWACDLSKAARRRVQALGLNLPILTAFSNDDDYENALADELTTFARLGDRLICLSCSGTSTNIIAVLRQAWILKMPRALLTGAAWLGMHQLDVCVQVRSHDYGIIEDVHSAIGHYLTKELSRDV